MDYTRDGEDPFGRERWVRMDQVGMLGVAAWSRRDLGRGVNLAECGRCGALALLDGSSMGAHDEWHRRLEARIGR